MDPGACALQGIRRGGDLNYFLRGRQLWKFLNHPFIFCRKNNILRIIKKVRNLPIYFYEK